MGKESPARSLTKDNRRIAAILVLTLAGTAVAFADDAAPTGQWVASVVNPDTHRPIAVTLDFKGAALGQPSGQLHFGAPRSCQLETEYSGRDGEAYYLAFTRSTGGYCDRLLDGGLSLVAKGSGLGFATVNKKGDRVDQGNFVKQSASAQ
jgi:hypothetical protein